MESPNLASGFHSSSYFILYSYIKPIHHPPTLLLPPVILQVCAIEFVAFAIEFFPFAIEFVGIAIEFVGIAIEFVPFAIVFVGFAIEFVAFALQFVINKTAPRNQPVH